MIQAFILGIVQGLTEFLPISSSAHLLLIPTFLDWPPLGLAFDVSLHIGTLLAVIIYFFGKWRSILVGGLKQGNTQARVVLSNLIIATIPAALVGYWAEPIIEHSLRQPIIAAVNLILFALILWAIDRAMAHKGTISSLTWVQALVVGLFQCLALIPGVSRSGITITGGRAMGLSREEATEFSFLLLAPITFGAAMSELPSIVSIPDWHAVLIGIVTSFFTGIAAIHIMLKLIKSFGFLPYIIYRVIAGLAFLLWLLY